MSKETQTSESLYFKLLTNLLQKMAGETGLGWRQQKANIRININPDDLLFYLRPKQLAPLNSQTPTLINILWHLADNCGDHAVKEGELLQISIQSKRTPDGLCIEICDNGPGIPRLEEQQVETSGLTRHNRSNLALATKQAWVLGAKIFAENIIEGKAIQGARFTIVFEGK